MRRHQAFLAVTLGTVLLSSSLTQALRIGQWFLSQIDGTLDFVSQLLDQNRLQTNAIFCKKNMFFFLRCQKI